MTIVRFIIERVAEDKQRAEAAARPARIPDGDSVLEVTDLAVQAPALEVLRRCAMITALMRHAREAGEYERDVKRRHGAWTDSELAEEQQIDHRIHRDIAAYWNTHTDYRDDWAPGCGHVDVAIYHQSSSWLTVTFRTECTQCAATARMTRTIGDIPSTIEARAALG
ncbi:DUF6221 family protein [Nocardia salmonicida]|uniref:DUF6221 family protein n=1 Tax=Nocardia salmonicida TaxID=53431 RepID=UPI003798E51E